MKIISSFILTIIISVTVFSQSPDAFSYQLVVRDNDGHLVKNSSIGMRISILKNSNSGTPVYVETHSPTTNDNGLVTIEVGQGSPEFSNFSSINWGENEYFVKTEIDINGGSNYSIIGSYQLLSVPYALHARSASFISNSGSPNLAVFPQSSYRDDVVQVSFAGSLGVNFTQATNTVALRFNQASPIYPFDRAFLNSQKMDATFFIPNNVLPGLYDVVVNPQSGAPLIISDAFLIK
ncbi:MAG: hypothetical protein ACJAZ3_001764 [Sphingobacteriales bacterium]|jgi:hypothetical protein